MTIEIKVRGFRGCEKADIVAGNIALIAGQNGAAKSSVCQAVAAALTGSPIPYFRSDKADKALLNKGDSKLLLHGGMKDASVTVDLVGSESKMPAASVAWPALTWEGTGALASSKVACGLITPLDMPDADRQKFFADLLKTDPTADDLKATIIEKIPELKPTAEEAAEEARTGGQKTRLGEIVAAVVLNGYDSSHTAAQSKRARLKARWEAMSNEAYGSKKAAGWRPQHWRKDLDGLTEEGAASVASRARERLDQLSANAAVGEAQIAELEEVAKGEVVAKQAVDEALAAHGKWMDIVAKRTEAANAIFIPTATPCPHCGGMVDIKGGTLEQSRASTHDISLAKHAKSEATAELQQAKQELDAAEKVLRGARGQLSSIMEAVTRLNAVKSKSVPKEKIDEARDYLNGCEADLAMVKAVAACEELAADIGISQKLVEILSPEGLRRQKLQKALAPFNKDFLAPLSAEAGFPAITINDDLEILYGGRHYFLLSESEKYRARSVIQIAVAMYDSSKVVIFDGADILDKDGRNGLFAMTGMAPDIHFVIGMTFSSKTNAAGKVIVPDLAKAEIGATYWMESGIAMPL